MRKKILLCAAIAMFTSTALAGLYQPAPLEIDLDARLAYGDMGSVSGSKDDIAFIGCGVRNVGPAGFRFGFCQAGDEFGNQITCFTFDPSLLDDMRASSDYSYIQFSWDWDSEPGGSCTLTRVGFSTQSFYLAKPK